MASRKGGLGDLWSEVIAEDQNSEEENEGANYKAPIAVIYTRRRDENECLNEVQIERSQAGKENRVSFAVPRRISRNKSLCIRGRESIVVGAGFEKPQKHKAQQRKPKQGPRAKKTPKQPDFKKEKAYFEEVDAFELVEESPSPKNYWKMSKNNDIVYHDLPAILERWKILKITRSCSRHIYKFMETPMVPSVNSNHSNSSTLLEKIPKKEANNSELFDKGCIIPSFESLRIKDEDESFDGVGALENNNIFKGIDGGIVKESLDIPSKSFSGECYSAFTQLLMACKQTAPMRLAEIFSTYCDPSSIRKIGEGTYGEAFRAGETVCKVVPIDGDLLVNGENQKRSEEVLEEVVLSLTLNNLREQKGKDVYNSSTSFIETKDFRVCHGVYDSSLIRAWEEWDAIHSSQNDHPKEFPEEQCYIVFVLAFGGKDLESFVLSNYNEARSLLVQVTAALAVAEASCEFEHRDLHWGNILLSREEACSQLEFTLQGRKRSINTFGLNISIIDFTLSRINTGEAILFLDLSAEPELFEGPKRDRQSETYRQMRKVTGDHWEGSFPKTNVLWLIYLVDTLLTKKTFTKDEKELRLLKKHLNAYDSAQECLSDTFFNGILM